MDRGVVAAVAISLLVLVAVAGAAGALLRLEYDPRSSVERDFAAGRLSAGPGIPQHLVITSVSGDRVTFAFDTSAGARCTGFREVRRGPLGMAAGGSGGIECHNSGPTAANPLY